MTREDWSKSIQANGRIDSSTKEWIENLVGEVYDELESRTCENCHWWTFYDGADMCMDLLIACDKDFGCNKFVSTDTKGEEDG